MVVINGVEIPEKSLYFVREVIGMIARMAQISESAARGRIYRRINDGRIEVQRIAGPQTISREVLMDLFRGM